jgi:hypothetical protein
MHASGVGESAVMAHDRIDDAAVSERFEPAEPAAPPPSAVFARALPHPGTQGFFDPHVRSMTVLRFAGDEANATPSGAEISAAGTPP